MINILNLGTITSRFGKRNAPTNGASTNHNGVDIVLDNKNVPAVTGGTVTSVGYNSARGNYITIKDSNGYTHLYQHLAKKPSYKVGTVIKEGTTIGIMGSTGISTGAHLHYEVQREGVAINPEDFLKGANGKVPGAPGTGIVNTGSGGLKWWGDIVKVVICALLILAGISMLVLGVNSTVKNTVMKGVKKL